MDTNREDYLFLGELVIKWHAMPKKKLNSILNNELPVFENINDDNNKLLLEPINGISIDYSRIDNTFFKILILKNNEFLESFIPDVFNQINKKNIKEDLSPENQKPRNNKIYVLKKNVEDLEKTYSKYIYPNNAQVNSFDADENLEKSPVLTEQEPISNNMEWEWEGADDREKKAPDHIIKLVAGWLELAKFYKKQKEIEFFTIGFEWIKGDCSQKKAYRACFGGEEKEKFIETQKQCELKLRKLFIEYAKEQGYNFSYLLKSTKK